MRILVTGGLGGVGRVTVARLIRHGHEVLALDRIVSNHDNSVGVPSKDLAKLYYPEVTTWRQPVEGTETLLSYARAQALIGYEPEVSLLAWVGEEEE